MGIETGKANILYVDDEANNLVSFNAAFRKYYNVFTATSAKEGVAILRKNDIQVIITDQRMPEMTGVQFLEAIIPDYPDTIRMILTGFSDIEAIVKAINCGHVFRYLTKPWDEQELKQTIDAGLSIYELEKENQKLLQTMQEEVQKQQKLLQLFQKYVPENIIADVVERHENPESIFEGEIRIITAFIGEIHDFNKLAAKLAPKQTLDYLNKYFTLVNDTVKKHNGTIINYLGATYLAIFGAPISYIDNQQNAVRCALEMIELGKQFNAETTGDVNFETTIGIGINTGDTILGNLGSKDRIAYAAVGDTVNTASRIVELTRASPNSILIAESTYLATKDDFQFTEVGAKPIRGKNENLNLYKVDIGKSNT